MLRPSYVPLNGDSKVEPIYEYMKRSYWIIYAAWCCVLMVSLTSCSSSQGDRSRSQRQRVLMARALATQPRLLVLDEPSTYIDRNSENHMYSLLQSLNKQCAIVLVSHDMGAVIQTVRNIACVNGTVHYHPATEPADHWFEHEIGCPLELVAHGHVPHRVLSEH